MIGQCVHSHGNTKVLQIIQKLAEIPEFFERNAMLMFDSVQKAIQVHVVFVGVLWIGMKFTISIKTNILLIFDRQFLTNQIGVSQQNFGKVHLGDGQIALGKFIKFQFEHFGLKIVHEFVEAIIMQVLVSFLAEEMHLQRSVYFVPSLQALLIFVVVFLQ